MADLPTGRDAERASDVAAVEGLFQDGPATREQRPVSPVAPEDAKGFDLVDEPEPARPRPAPPVWMTEDEESPDRSAGRSRASSRIASSSAVDQVWTRWAEWGAEVVLLGIWATFILFLLYLTVGAEYYTMALTVLALGLFGGLVLAYPMLITLERPVRMAPERAVKDFYDALSHHRPHYRRMWLLLSNAGRTSAKFASYEGFKKYWSDILKGLKHGRASAWTPLMFQVVGFKAKKSDDKTTADASWTVDVFIRGKHLDGPIASLPMESTFSKGADNMWYIDQGTLDERSSIRVAPSASGRGGGETAS